jgi:uncharacterized protein YdeI (BOF family)
MKKSITLLAALLASGALVAVDGTALAQGKGKDKEPKEQGGGKPGGQKEHGAGQQKAKKAKHENGKTLVGDKIKKNGKQKFHEHGKNSAFVDVKDGKIAGVSVQNADAGNVPVTKYKTNKKMADASSYGMVPASMQLAQYMGTTWIGYAYVDEYGEEVIYWFPYDMIYDGDTGAIDYVPAY